jgi:hypothetical protein
MYEPYPTSGPQQMPQGQPAPQSVLTAVKLMYVGAGLSTLGLVVSLLTIGSLKTAILKRQPNLTSSQLHTAQTVGVAGAIIVGLLGVGLWIWMARANGAGKNWARILSSVLFGLATLDLLLSLGRANTIIARLFGLLVWLIGLGAIVLLWRKESSAYFSSQGR